MLTLRGSTEPGGGGSERAVLGGGDGGGRYGVTSTASAWSHPGWLNRGRRINDLNLEPVIRRDGFQRIRVLGKISVKRTLLCCL